MKYITITFILVLSLSFNFTIAQHHNISTIDFVQVLNDNTSEAIFYYENNWKQLRIKAVEKGFIDSFELMMVQDKDSEFQIILKTTYKDQEQYDKREEHFNKLIAESSGLKLLNNKEPKEFRKTLFGRDTIHL